MNLHLELEVSVFEFDLDLELDLILPSPSLSLDLILEKLLELSHLFLLVLDEDLLDPREPWLRTHRTSFFASVRAPLDQEC